MQHLLPAFPSAARSEPFRILSGLAPGGMAERRAAPLWRLLIEHWRGLCAGLDRDPGLRVALLDLAESGRAGPDLAAAAFRERVAWEGWMAAAAVDRRSGLLRPWYFRQRLEEELARRSRRSDPLTLVMLEPIDGGDAFPGLADFESGTGGKGVDHAGRSQASPRRLISGWLRAGDAVCAGEGRLSVLLPATDRDQMDRLFARLDRAPATRRLRCRAAVITAPAGVDGGTWLDAAAQRLGPSGPIRQVSLPVDPGPGSGPGWSCRTVPPNVSVMAASRLRRLTGLIRPEPEAAVLWTTIENRRRRLSVRLGRPIGIGTAGLDEMVNGCRLLRDPVLVTHRQIRECEADGVEDPETGWSPIPFLQRRLEEEVRRARRHRHPVSLVRLDQSGGGEPVRPRMRRYDTGARWAGRDLVLLLPGADRRASRRVAARLAAAGGVRVGRATYPDDSTRPGRLLELARPAPA